LRARPRERVEVELDGERWRTLPAEVILSSGLVVGTELGRERARRLNRELRRHEAMTRAARALARRDLSVRELDNRLERSQVAPAARDEAVARLARVGIVDDERLAQGRAELLAARGSGDALIRHDLAGRGIAEELVEGALAALEPEHARAARILRERGSSPKTARYLARKGFSEESVGDPVAEDAPPAVR
jgi:SOS response regulatory protein OraA/RecX